MRLGTAGRILAATMSVGMLMLLSCSPTPPRQRSAALPPSAHLSANEQIAGEIMAYMLEVVLGRAGALENRRAWSTRGCDLPLNFDLVYRRMYGPVPLRAELMVLDTNILGVSQVLYHYDRRMNLFKGLGDHDSLFPCAELMAIRLFLLQKLRDNETVSIAAMANHADLFAADSRDATASELAAMHLNPAEFSFLKSIFQSEPVFLNYMQHPFVVSTLKRIGVAKGDASTVAADQAADYRRLACPVQPLSPTRPTTIAVLPSMVALFEADPATGDIRPSAEYDRLQAKLQATITRRLQGVIDQAHRNRLTFYTPARPLTIHPQNADQVVGQLCPFADFTVILLGKNVYRALLIDPDTDIYPHKNIIYLDVDDIRYGQIDQEIEAIATALLPHPAS